MKSEQVEGGNTGVETCPTYIHIPKNEGNKVLSLPLTVVQFDHLLDSDLVPRHREDGLKGFFWPRQRYPDEAALRQVQDTLREALARLQSSNN